VTGRQRRLGGQGPGLERLILGHGVLTLPAFLPDATQGVVRGVDASDLEACGVQAVMMNVFHLMQRPGSSAIRALGGLHRAFGWERPIMTDSGGFQAYSLIRENPRLGSLTDRGLLYRPEGARGKVILTPEKSIALQMAYGADIVVCLDHCTHPSESYSEQREAVRRTIAWARRCRAEYDRRAEQLGDQRVPRPLLFGVVQGGNEPSLRRKCAEELLAVGFDGYGLGGWPFDEAGNLLTDVIGYTRELIPPEYPMHALGVGHPDHLLALWRMGYQLFDASMPTRDARHGRLMAFDHEDVAACIGPDGIRFHYVYVQDEAHYRDGHPVSQGCDCLLCRRYSRAYLHHLFKTGDSLYHRLATMHNLRFVARLVAALRRREGAA